MSDIVTRLRDWRNVHLARLHLLMEEAADQIAILESKLSLREDLEQGLMDGVARLQAEVERLRNGALTARETVSQNGDCLASDNVANRDNTPAAHDTQCEGREQNRCTLTDEERAAIEWAVQGSDIAAKDARDAIDRGYREPELPQWAANHERRSNTLRSLLERL